MKGLGFESLQEQRENVLLQDQLSVLTLILVSVPLLRQQQFHVASASKFLNSVVSTPFQWIFFFF